MSDDSGWAGRHDDMVDWSLAVTTAKRLMRPGPEVSRTEAAEVVSQLRRFAADSTDHVREFSGLEAPAGTAPVLVVDRTGWVEANIEGLRFVLRPLVAKIRDRRGDPSPVVHAVGSRITGVEAGGLFAFLGSKVLGQFDPFFGTGATTGRLLLVAPNVVQVERELRVNPADFRLWVCLHEETHRVQFTAVPWLRDYLLSQIETLVGSADLDPSRLAAMLRDGIQAVGDMVRGESEVSLLDIVQTPEQRIVLDRLTAVMSLLEGHADVVMDGVGPRVVGSVREIRDKFSARRAGVGGMDQILRRLLGLDAKLRQYRDGAAFVRGVLDKTSMADFNAVWAGEHNLPSREEIAEPALWIRRVLG